MFRRYIIAIVIVVFANGVLFGEEPNDLIDRLYKLVGDNPVCTAVNIEYCTSEAGMSKKIEQADLVLTVNTYVFAVTIKDNLSPRQSGPEQGEKVRASAKILKDFSLFRASELLNYGPSLAHELKGLKLVEKTSSSYEGISCVRWRLQTKENMSMLGLGVKIRHEVDLWIDVSGYPIAALFKSEKKGRLGFVKFISVSKRKQRFEQSGRRLILVFEKDEEDGSFRSKKFKKSESVVTVKTTKVEIK